MGREGDRVAGINEELLEAALRRLLATGDAMAPPPQGAPYAAPYPPGPHAQQPYPFPGFAPGGPGGGGYGAAVHQGMAGWPGSGQAAAGGQASQSFQQALIWAALGAAAAWVLSDPAVRDKLIKQAMKIYLELVVGFQEVKDRVADLKADVDAGSRGKRPDPGNE
jgi:hypothetical protein